MNLSNRSEISRDNKQDQSKYSIKAPEILYKEDNFELRNSSKVKRSNVTNRINAQYTSFHQEDLSNQTLDNLPPKILEHDLITTDNKPESKPMTFSAILKDLNKSGEEYLKENEVKKLKVDERQVHQGEYHINIPGTSISPQGSILNNVKMENKSKEASVKNKNVEFNLKILKNWYVLSLMLIFISNVILKFGFPIRFPFYDILSFIISMNYELLKVIFKLQLIMPFENYIFKSLLFQSFYKMKPQNDIYIQKINEALVNTLSNKKQISLSNNGFKLFKSVGPITSLPSINSNKSNINKVLEEKQLSILEKLKAKNEYHQKFLSNRKEDLSISQLKLEFEKIKEKDEINNLLNLAPKRVIRNNLFSFSNQSKVPLYKPSEIKVEKSTPEAVKILMRALGSASKYSYFLPKETEQLFDYTENVDQVVLKTKFWIVKFILCPLLESIELVDKEMEKRKLFHLKSNIPASNYLTNIDFNQFAIPGTFGTKDPKIVAAFSQNNPFVKKYNPAFYISPTSSKDNGATSKESSSSSTKTVPVFPDYPKYTKLKKSNHKFHSTRPPTIRRLRQFKQITSCNPLQSKNGISPKDLVHEYLLKIHRKQKKKIPKNAITTNQAKENKAKETKEENEINKEEESSKEKEASYAFHYSLSDMLKGCAYDSIIIKRIEIERYLNIANTETKRNEIIRRIKELASTLFLEKYKGNYNGETNIDIDPTLDNDGKPEPKVKHTDYDLLLHLFVTKMNIGLFDIPLSFTSFYFAKNYFAFYGQDIPEASKNTNIQFYLKELSPGKGHLVLVDSKHRHTFGLPKGDNNLFLAIFSLAMLIKDAYDGKIFTNDEKIVQLDKKGLDLAYLISDSN